MSEDVIVEAHIDPDIRDRASKILENVGLTVSDALRIMLTRTVEQGALPAGLEEDPEYDAWVREQVQEALDDPSPGIPHEKANREMAEFKAEVMRKLAAKEL